jgi:hypothetical protein
MSQREWRDELKFWIGVMLLWVALILALILQRTQQINSRGVDSCPADSDQQLNRRWSL